MNKYHGKVGYSVTEKSTRNPGIWEETIIEREYKGDIIKQISKWNVSGNSSNDNLGLNGQISIVADAFAYENFSHIKFIVHMGAAWKVEMAEPKSPRIILTLGGVWNGERASIAE